MRVPQTEEIVLYGASSLISVDGAFKLPSNLSNQPDGPILELPENGQWETFSFPSASF
jgi:hypothetical protein